MSSAHLNADASELFHEVTSATRRTFLTSWCVVVFLITQSPRSKPTENISEVQLKVGWGSQYGFWSHWPITTSSATVWNGYMTSPDVWSLSTGCSSHEVQLVQLSQLATANKKKNKHGPSLIIYTSLTYTPLSRSEWIWWTVSAITGEETASSA